MGKDYNSLIGLLVAYALVSLAIWEPVWFLSISSSFTQFFIGINQNLGIFFDLPTFMIVLGGSFGAVVTNFKLDDIKKLGPLTVQAALAPSEGDESETINQIVELSQEARVNGLLSLEPKIKTIESEFLRTGLEMVVDGTDVDEIRNSMENDLSFMQRRHQKGQQIFLQFGMFCPAFGMVGTLVGLVKMMTDLTDIVQIAANMQVALLTTFWGSLIANTLFLPVAGKLQVLSNNEVVIKEMMIEGVLSIPKGENPKVLKKYLETFIAPKRRIDA